MALASFCFDAFRLDPAERLLTRAGTPVDLNARYLDALALLVREHGQLVTKDRFLADVWRGVPVTDEALTQCIATLRRQLGDSAANPRFIETIPKHGYRFIAAVTADADVHPAVGAGGRSAQIYPWRDLAITGGSGTAGASVAGILGGIFYGFAGAAQPGMGAVSGMLVLACLTLLVALLGGAGVAFGIAAAELAGRGRWQWSVAGGALGGLLVGAMVKLLGLDAFELLFGRSPGAITGAAEGALLGGAIGLGAWWGRSISPARAMLATAATAGAGGVLIAFLGGRLLGGSLDLLARSFPGSRLQLDQIGMLFGESGFGPISRMVTGGLEGALFGACLVGAMTAARYRLGRNKPMR